MVSESTNYISLWNLPNKKVSRITVTRAINTRHATLKRCLSEWDKIEVLSEAHSDDSTLDTVICTSHTAVVTKAPTAYKKPRGTIEKPTEKNTNEEDDFKAGHTSKPISGRPQQAKTNKKKNKKGSKVQRTYTILPH